MSAPKGLHDTLLLRSALFSLLVMGGEVHVGSHRPTAGVSGPTTVAVFRTARTPDICPAPPAPDALAGRKTGYHLLRPAKPPSPEPRGGAPGALAHAGAVDVNLREGNGRRRLALALSQTRVRIPNH